MQEREGGPLGPELLLEQEPAVAAGEGGVERK